MERGGQRGGRSGRHSLVLVAKDLGEDFARLVLTTLSMLEVFECIREHGERDKDKVFLLMKHAMENYNHHHKCCRHPYRWNPKRHKRDKLSRR